jgi:glycosyltransferase involved in cell wall biosynthesis
MKSIWLDVTTTLRWRRPPVGILRVERELIQYHQNQGKHCRFVKFDDSKCTFVEVQWGEIMGALLSQEAFQDMGENKTEPTVHLIREKVILSKKEKILREINRIFKKIDLILRVLGFRKELRSCMVEAGGVPNQLTIEEIQKDKTYDNQFELDPPCCMQVNDRYISCGLDWDDKNLPFLYKIKKKLNLNITLFCYDLIPILLPHLVVLNVGSKFQEYFCNMAWCADTACCISKNSETDFKKHSLLLGSPLPKTVVIRLGENSFGLGNSKGIKESLLSNKKFILFVSTVEKRKNHVTVLHAYTRLCERHGDRLPHLVFVGMPGWGVSDFFKDLELDFRVKERVIWFKKLPDAELRWLYENCLFTVFPSHYEGWGLPVAESLAFGKYCLISDSSSLVEVAPHILTPIDPLDVPDWVTHMEKMIFDPIQLKEKELKIRNEYQLQNWSDTFSKIPAYSK